MKRFVRHIEQGSWYVLLATVGLQTRLILWRADALFSEWRAIALWGTDLAMIALVGSALLQGWRPRRLTRDDWLLVGFAGVALLSIGNALAPGIAMYQLVRLGFFIILFFCLRQWVLPRVNRDTSLAAFIAGSIGQAVLGIAQSVAQHDIGLRWAGETLLVPAMHGVAVFYDGAGEKILRAYGTTPHPNVLAVQLMLALWALGWLYLRVRHPRGTVGWRREAIWATSATLLLWALYATFSRTVIAVWVVASALLLWVAWSRFRAQCVRMVALVALVSAIFLALQWPRVYARMSIHASDEAVQYRLDYARDSLGSGGGNFLHINWLGVGIGNFTTWLAYTQPQLPDYQVQPAHNLFLLIYSEMGVVGLLVWVIWLLFVFRGVWRLRASSPLLRVGAITVLGALVAVAMFDHLFWTLQQGHLFWWLVLAFVS